MDKKVEVMRNGEIVFKCVTPGEAWYYIESQNDKAKYTVIDYR